MRPTPIIIGLLLAGLAVVYQGLLLWLSGDWRWVEGGDMATLLNVGRTDRVLRLLLGIGLGGMAILVDGHPYARWALVIGGFW